MSASPARVLQRNTIRMIVCRHEGGAGYMAVADGRLRKRAGCCIVSRGPGLSNAMVSLHSAYHDATPMVMLVGQVERKDFGRLALQEQNYSRLLSDVTKLVIEVNEPEQASEAIARAFHIAESGTQGPVAVILPEDIFDETTDAELDQPRPRAAGRATRRGSRPAGGHAGDALSGRWCWWAARCWPMRCTTKRCTAICAASPRTGCCRSARRIAAPRCSTRGIRTTAAIWASACRAS